MTNTDKIIERMQGSFPHIYNVYNKNTILYALLTVFGSKYGIRTDIIDRLYAMIGIDSTYDKDLEHRWGSLLGVYKQSGESMNNYRNRLKIVYSSLSGGTAEAIKYAVASAAGIDSDVDVINDYVHVYDAWEYPFDYDPLLLLGIDDITEESALYSSIICTVDLAGINGAIEYDRIMDAINQTKASGINPGLIFLYNVEESSPLMRDAIRFMDNITFNIDTIEDANIGYTEASLDLIPESIHERISFGGTLTNVWSNFGTNSAILNQTFTTNIFVEPDEHIDIIHRSGSNDNSAVLNVGILGKAIFNTK